MSVQPLRLRSRFIVAKEKKKTFLVHEKRRIEHTAPRDVTNNINSFYILIAIILFVWTQINIVCLVHTRTHTQSELKCINMCPTFFLQIFVILSTLPFSRQLTTI